MKTLIAGTFDNFHVGHQWLIWQAFKQAQPLIIIVARDKTVTKIKGAKPRNSELKRLERVLKEIKNYPQITARLGRTDGHFEKTIQEEKPQKILLGYDQQFSRHLEEKYRAHITLERVSAYKPEFFKSSKF